MERLGNLNLDFWDSVICHLVTRAKTLWSTMIIVLVSLLCLSVMKLHLNAAS